MKRGIEQLRLAIAEWIMGDLAIWFVPKRWKPVYLQAVVLAMAQTFDTETMSGKPYTCDHCGGTFEGRDDAEANVEAKELWGVDNASEREDMAVVCDDCFQQICPGGKPIPELTTDEFIAAELVDLEELRRRDAAKVVAKYRANHPNITDGEAEILRDVVIEYIQAVEEQFMKALLYGAPSSPDEPKGIMHLLN